jgi:hypothetical protein
MRTHYFLALILFVFGCTDVEDDHDHDHEQEVITTVVLSFTWDGSDAVSVFEWSDAENDGSPVADDIALLDATSYSVSVSLWNELEEPAEELTEEIADEADEHQIFFTGSAVQGPATGENAEALVEHAYADQDTGGLPVGLENTFSTLGIGTGDLVLTLRHLPVENDAAVKVDGLASEVAAGGFESIGGDNDVQITFSLEVL